ncbi:alpha/beta hydrolase [Gelidibacter maritimus]|uniref:Esterase family protein n=1 Tax=Gelidibacter maritimus TaxID=2761487 RepID=A0A7W2M448_9FLAO|nr:alpha/beta hydrolase family protein [Gelidibacter maritimus]MBA6152379.1 esterase family protein [Gelidibacter maritimus]
MKQKLLILLLACYSLTVHAAKVDTVTVWSASMNKSIPNLVILPDQYADTKLNFPVLYLLHGAGGNHTNWLAKVPRLKAYVDAYNLIIVCPDGGETSWYFDSPVDDQMRYETYMAEELISSIDSIYNTLADKSGRAITGLSMGGHGALYLAFKHQDIWGAAGSMSGGVDIRPFPNNWDLPKRLGTYAEHKNNWEEHTVINLVYKLQADRLKLIIDCGIDDFFYEVNKRLHEKLLERNIPHDYIERPGQHNWAYWKNAIAYQLLFFDKHFKRSDR